MKEKEILELMSNIDSCYRTDLMLVLKENTYGYSSTIIKKLLDKQYIEQKEISCKDDYHRKTIDVLSITKKGRIFLSNSLDDNDYSVKMESFTHPRFASSNIKEIHKGLATSRILLFMHQAGVRTFPKDKPSLLALQNMAHNATPRHEELYNNELPVSEILKTGVFYTKEEINHFYNTETLKDENDTFSGTRIRGIYADTTKTCVIFQPNIFKSRTLKLSLQDEKRAITSIRTHMSFSQLNGVKDFDAIILTNGSALIVDIGIIGKNGKVSNRRTLPKTIGAYKKNGSHTHLLSSSTSLYPNMYCFSHDLIGVRGLRYFRKYQSIAEQNAHIKEYGVSGNFSFIPNSQPDAEFILIDDNTDDNTFAVFIPYFNLKQLERIKNKYESISIITQKEMADSISHILRRDNRIYDLDGNLLDVDRYQENGLKVGLPTPEPKKRYYKQKKAMIRIEITEEMRDLIKQNAKLEDISMSKYIRKLLIPALKQDTRAKSEILKQEDNIKKEIDKHLTTSFLQR